MSRRKSILNALVEKLKDINGIEPFMSNIYGNAYPTIKFWDEVTDFPCIYTSIGTETREYHPSNFKWGYIPISLKVYCKGDTAAEDLENLIGDIESVIDANQVLVYDVTKGYETTEILITSIVTDEGLLAPYAIGEVNLQIRYQIM